MRTKICLLIIFGLLFFVFSKAEASITWTADDFDYNATDVAGFYYNATLSPAMVLLGSSSDRSQANGDSENSAVATAVEPQQGVSTPGLNMTSGAWGNSFQDLSKDSGGATVYAYADNSYTLDAPIGVFQNGQKVSSYIERYFTVDSNRKYTLSASAAAPFTWSTQVSGTATAPQPSLTGWVYLIQTDSGGVTTTVHSFSIAALLSASQQVDVSLVSGNTYQLVVALSGVTELGGRTTPGLITSFNSLDPSLNALGNIDGTFNAGTQSSPVSITASLSPATAPPPPWWQQGAVDLKGGWWWSWFGYYYASTSSSWLYNQTLGWLYPAGTSTDDLWFYDPQWDGQGAWWWTSDSIFPWLYCINAGSWFFYDTDSTDARWFYDWNTRTWEQH